MEKFRVGFLRLIGFFYAGVGLYILYSAAASGQGSFLSVLTAAAITAAGAALAWRADHIVKSQPPVTQLQKTISRRIIIFTFMMLGYILLAVFIAVRADMRGVNIRRIMIIEAIGFAAVVGAYIWLLHQIIVQRKNYRIQDPVMARHPVFEQNMPFHLLVSDVHESEGRVSVRGKALGTVSPGNTVWALVYGSAMRLTAAEVIPHETETELVFENVPEERFKDAVITTRVPYRYTTSEAPFANAELSALLEFLRAKEEIPPEYMLRIAWLAARGTFLVRTLPEPAVTPFQKLHRWLFGYSGFFRTGTVHRENSAEDFYAAYTDWDAYNRIREEDSPESAAMILTFPQIMEVRAKQPGGVVLNPFGPVSFLLSESLLDHIMEQSWYKNDIARETDRKKSGKDA